MMLKHLLPVCRAWQTTIDNDLRRLIVGLSGIEEDLRAYFDELWLNLMPSTTDYLDDWEEQFGLPAAGLTETERRDRLDGRWKALGGQSPYYIQTTLQDAGFDVYVHDWWVPGTEPAIGSHACATPRNPLVYLRREYASVGLMVECGEALAECGEAFAECGNQVDPRGYPLVNKTFATIPNYLTLCGEALAQCGEPTAECGNFFGFTEEVITYIIPNDPAYWPFFVYIGGQTFGDIAQLPPSRKNEFEELCLKICPSHLWIGVLVEYI